MKQAGGRDYSVPLWALFGLFLFRVLAQLAVALTGFAYLPSMDEWYSGLLPYQYLLPAHVLIAGTMAKVCWDIGHQRGRFAEANRTAGRVLMGLGLLYLLAMVARYVLRMAFYPEERWFGGALPIIFHWVLASFLLVLARYHLRASEERLGG